MPTLEQVLGFLGKAPWYSREGIFWYTVSIIFLFALGIPFFEEVFGIQVPLKTAGIAIGGTILLYWCAVAYKRSWWQIRFSSKTSIVLAYNFLAIPSSERKLAEELYESFRQRLLNKIAEYDLSNEIRVVKRPTDVRIKSAGTAEAKTMLGLPGKTILIWGAMERTRKKFSFRTSVSYEFGYPSRLDENAARTAIGNSVNKVMGIGVFGRPRSERRRGELQLDSSVLTDESFLAIMFILAIVSSTHRREQKTIELLRRFISLYKIADPATTEKELLKSAYIEATTILARILSNECARQSHAHSWNELRMTASEMITLEHRESKYLGYCNLALAYWYLGLVPDSKNAARSASAFAERNDYIHKLDFAFFNLVDGDYSKALKLYEQVTSGSEFNPLFVVESLHDQYQKTQDPAFIFAEGYILHKFTKDRLGSILQFDIFLKESETRQEKYFELREYALRALNQLRSEISQS